MTTHNSSDLDTAARIAREFADKGATAQAMLHDAVLDALTAARAEASAPIPDGARPILDRIVTLLAALHPDHGGYSFDVTVGVSDEKAMAIMASVGAPLHTSHYWEEGTAIDGRDLYVNGVRFHAQSGRRLITDEERSAEGRRKELRAQMEKLQREMDALREHAA